MMALLVVVGYMTVIAVIIAAVLESKRIERGEKSLLSKFDKEPKYKK